MTDLIAQTGAVTGGCRAIRVPGRAGGEAVSLPFFRCGFWTNLPDTVGNIIGIGSDQTEIGDDS